MRIQYLQHVPFEGPAYLTYIARNPGVELAGTRLFVGDPLPDPEAFDLLVVMGGPMGARDEADYAWLAGEKRCIERSIKAGKRVLGICLGAQLIADVLGAPVYKNRYREIGWFPVYRGREAAETPIGQTLPDIFYAFHWHGDTFDVPGGALHLAESAACKNQGFTWEDRILALQFHLEATPESVNALLDNCGHELDGSKYVQNADDIRKFNHAGDCHRLFEDMVNSLIV